MKTVLISIKPKWCELIANGKKTIEVRKTAPKEVPFKCYIYETKFINHCNNCKCYLFDCSGLGKALDICTYGDRPRITSKSSRCWQDKYSGGKVIGEFICDKVYGIYYSIYPHDPFIYEEIGKLNRPNLQAQTHLSQYELDQYLNGKNGYAWHISNLKIYDTPKELSEFKKGCHSFCADCGKNIYWGGNCEGEITRPPQSWQYIEEQK